MAWLFLEHFECLLTIIAQASGDKDELLVTDLDMEMVREVRELWQFFRDRRPESYGAISAPN